MKMMTRAIFYLAVILLSACSTSNPAQIRELTAADEPGTKQVRYQNFLDSQARTAAGLKEKERAREVRRQYDEKAFWAIQNRAAGY